MKIPRTVLAILTILVALSAPLGSLAQPVGGKWRVGILDASTPNPERQAQWESFRKALRESGYLEGENVVFEHRWGYGQFGSLRELANELLHARANVIVTAGTPAALAAKQATATIPIVLVIAGDPVRTGLVASLARPGGNVTGLTTLSTELSAKRLQLLRDLLPTVSQLGLLWDDNPAFALAVQDTELAARNLKVSIRTATVRSRDDLEAGLAQFVRPRVEALEVMPGQLVLAERRRIADFALEHRLPTMYAQREYVEAGGLMSYGSSLSPLFLRAATYVDKILKGSKPADLPVEQPTTFELAINVRTARILGLTVSPALRARADYIVE